jgi:GDP-L-fucose synthase
MKVLVLGGHGFLGRHVMAKLAAAGIEHEGRSLSDGFDLTDASMSIDAINRIQPSHIINCAAFVGGIQYGYRFPADIFRINLQMTLNLLEISRQTDVTRIVNPISNCAYPGRLHLFREEEFWDGPLHESVLAYGFARKASSVGSWAYHQQYGTDWVNLILSNMYGPEDHFEEERSHALGALIMKTVRARENGDPSITVWGTGTPVREWLYVEDGAEALVRALEVPGTVDPVNVGVASGVSIAQLVEMITEAVGYTGAITYDTSKPDGAPYKTVDGTKGKELLGWAPSTDLQEGIRRTVEWYLANR